MAAYSQRDQQLLTEAYSLQILKESIPQMSLNQVNKNLDLMTESELEYVSNVSERILNEFLGGLKNLMGAGRGAVASGAGTVANTGSSIGQGLKNAGSTALNTVKGLGKGALAAGKQVVDNTKDIYNTGVQDQKSQKAIEKAQALSQQLIDLVVQAQQSGILGQVRGNIADMPLSDIIDTLDAVKQSTSDFASQAKDKGFTGGASGAFRRGMQS